MSKTFEEAYAVTSRMCPDTYTFEKPECRKYWELLTQLDPTSVVVEIGLQFGRSSTLVAQAAKEIRIPAHRDRTLSLIPQCQGNVAEKYGGSWPSSYPFDTYSNDPRVWNRLPLVVDLALVDGDHWESGWQFRYQSTPKPNFTRALAGCCSTTMELTCPEFYPPSSLLM